MHQWQLQPGIQPGFGAYVTGVDVGVLNSTEFAHLVMPALLTWGLLVFRGQRRDLSPQELFKFTSYIPDAVGQQAPPFAKRDPSCLPNYTAIRALGNSRNRSLLHGAEPEENAIGREWHTDGVGVTALFAVEVPDRPNGVNARTTLFACGYRAFELLSREQQLLAMEINGHYGSRFLVEESVASMARLGAQMTPDGRALAKEVPYTALTAEQLTGRSKNLGRWKDLQGPPVKRHPISGKHTLFVTPLALEYFDRLDGSRFTVNDSRSLLADLLLRGTSATEVYEHIWKSGDLLLFDNRRTLHSTTQLVAGEQLLYQIFTRTATPMLPPILHEDAADSDSEREICRL
eukprot:SAG31_NODE_5_length_43735_cov_42.922266_42_plen_346_part_00